jgi:hypothetical protein
MKTTGRILLDLNELAKETEELLHNAKLTEMFTMLAEAIRCVNADRLMALDEAHDAVNGTTLPEGASDVEEFQAAHAQQRINEALAITGWR